MEEAVNTIRIYNAHVTLKESVRNFARARCALDSGSGDVLITDPLLTPVVVWVEWIDQFYSCIQIDSGVT